MLETVVLMKLLFVREIQLRPVETLVLFSEGLRGVISQGGNDTEYWIRLLQGSLDGEQPVGIAFDDHGRITTVGRADNDVVAHVARDRDENLEVGFQGHDGRFHLRHDHPEFERIEDVLEQSRTGNRPVWFVTSGPRLVIVDVIWRQRVSESDRKKSGSRREM